MSSEYPERFPQWVNPWRMAEGRQSLAGSIPLCRFKRLADRLYLEEAGCENYPAVRFNADFGPGVNGKPVVRLRVIAELPLLCQRSLEGYTEALDTRVELTLVDNDPAAAPTTDNHIDDGTDTVLVDSQQLWLLEVVEDELLLALPLVAKNPELPRVEYHSVDRDYKEPEKQNPFAALKGLQNKD